MIASDGGFAEVVKYLVRHGARLADEASTSCTIQEGQHAGQVFHYTMNAIGQASLRGHNDVVTLITAIDAAGGWRKYAATLRHPHCLLRLRVGATYARLPVGHSERELYHFIYGRNNIDMNASAGSIEDERAQAHAMSVKELKAAAKKRGVSLSGYLEKADIVAAVLAFDADARRPMKTLPDDVFALIIKFLCS